MIEAAKRRCRTLSRRAEAYIRADAEEPIALCKVAEAAGCSVRSLQLGFRRFREATPMAAIRLALRFGFTNPGHFAYDYKAAFGEAPRDALHRSSGHRRHGR